MQCASEGRTLASSPLVSSSPRGRRVLIVDDNPDVAATLAEVVALLGYDVTEAHDGCSAIDAALRVEPDVIFLDLGLPDIGGHDVARQIRANAGEPSPVIVAVTGWGRPEDVERSRAAGIDHHVVKPITMQTIITILGTMTEHDSGIPISVR